MRLPGPGSLVLSAFLLGVALSACGGDPTGSTIDDSNPGSPAIGAGAGDFGAGKNDDPPAGGPACASAAVEAKLAPLSLVFMVDRSGSMGDSAQKKLAKWDPVVAALKSFFGSKGAAGVSASLSYFPQGDPDDKEYCAAATYQKPAVALSALPSGLLAASLDDTTPDGDGTPGAPALQGALAQASAIASSTKEAVAVVLVTDGDPNKCASSPAQVAQIAASFKGKVPTFVIGIGSVATLNDIAKAGGTNAAEIVTLGNPTQTRDDFVKTVAKIRGASLACEIAIPKPPAGQSLDLQKVNLTLTTAGKTTELASGKDCAAGAGWRYDDPAKPTKLVLCPSTCDAAKGEGKLAVTFGCATKVVVQ
jgi:hypothetical protein